MAAVQPPRSQRKKRHRVRKRIRALFRPKQTHAQLPQPPNPPRSWVPCRVWLNNNLLPLSQVASSLRYLPIPRRRVVAAHSLHSMPRSQVLMLSKMKMNMRINMKRRMTRMRGMKISTRMSYSTWLTTKTSANRPQHLLSSNRLSLSYRSAMTRMTAVGAMTGAPLPRLSRRGLTTTLITRTQT